MGHVHMMANGQCMHKRIKPLTEVLDGIDTGTELNLEDNMKLNMMEILHKNISDSIADLIDVQELVLRHKFKDGNMISQEAGKVIAALNTLEGRFPDLECEECEMSLDIQLDNTIICDDPLCGMRGKRQHI